MPSGKGSPHSGNVRAGSGTVQHILQDGVSIRHGESFKDAVKIVTECPRVSILSVFLNFLLSLFMV